MLSQIIDHHVHTCFSPDCETKMEILIERARTLGLKQLMFTDHVDYDSTSPIFKNVTDYNKYMKVIKDLQNKNKDIEILMGVEIGYQAHLKEKLKDLLSAFPFEFVICSIHCHEGMDFYNGDFFKGKSQYEAYDEYFRAVKNSIENYKGFDVYGHLDYIIRYGDYEKKEINYIDYREVIDEILKLLIQNGKGIEMNTSGIRYGLGVMPNIDILRRYKELGGEIITIGSDAHRAKDLQANFKEAINMLRNLGYKRITQFKKRKPIFINIE